eukprot:2837161-Rhodomonas_salina.2
MGGRRFSALVFQSVPQFVALVWLRAGVGPAVLGEEVHAGQGAAARRRNARHAAAHRPGQGKGCVCVRLYPRKDVCGWAGACVRSHAQLHVCGRIGGALKGCVWAKGCVCFVCAWRALAVRFGGCDRCEAAQRCDQRRCPHLHTSPDTLDSRP